MLLCALLPLGAGAEDLIVPDWRGQEGSTYQQWRFDNDDNPAVPEEIYKPYGSAEAQITPGWMASGWMQGGIPWYLMQGLWDLGGSGGSIVLEVDNRLAGSGYKEIWIQVTYLQNPSEAPAVTVPGAEFVSQQNNLIAPDPPSNWYGHHSVWRIEPNVDHEQIVVTSDADWGSVIDQIVIDTYSSTCMVDHDDLVCFSAQWLQQGTDLEADFDKDNDVDLKDFAVLAALWQKPCPSDWPWP